MNKLISVIIPVYNAEKYLRTCIDSIRKQTFNNWEIILIDDGSTDHSLEICNEYANLDNRILVIHQENAGAGSARNVGIDAATGRYLVFVDSDDIIREDYFAYLSQHDEDVVFIDANDIDEYGDIVKREYMSPFKDFPLDDIVRAQMTGKLPWGGWRKAVRRDLIVMNCIRYTSFKVGEEALYSFRVMDKARSVAFIPHALYQYVQRPDSLSRSSSEDPWGDVAIGLRDFIRNDSLNLYTKYANTLNAFLVVASAASCQRLAQMYSYGIYKQKSRLRRALLKNQLDYDIPIDWEHLSVKAKIAGFCVLYNFRSILWLLSKLKQ